MLFHIGAQGRSHLSRGEGGKELKCGLGSPEETQNPAHCGFPDAKEGRELQAKGMVCVCRQLGVQGGRAQRVWNVPMRSLQVWGCHGELVKDFKKGNNEILILERSHWQQNRRWIGTEER